MDQATLLLETLRLRPAADAAALVATWRQQRGAGLAAWVAYERAPLWLLRRLRDLGAEAAAPAPFTAALAAQGRDESARNLLVDAEAVATVRRLNDAGVPSVLLKGVARRAAGARYPYGDARATHDVDVLVPAADLGRAAGVLAAAGYRAVADERPHHAAPLMGPLGVAVELHRSTSHTVAPDEAWRRATDGGETLSWQGEPVRLPAATELLWHGLSHALHHGTRAFRLRFLLDGASIMAGGAALDWARVARRLDGGDVDRGDARRWLGGAAALAGSVIPDAVRGDGPALDLRRLVRWRLAVLARLADAGAGARLLEEGLRVELGRAAAPAPPAAGALKRLRRRLGGQAARVGYRLWRATPWRP